jgi:CheY-like chemotaxis protein
LLLGPVLEPHVLPPFLLAIAGAALVGGLGPGLFAAVLSAVGVNYWFFPPPDRLGFASQADLVAQLVFWSVALLVAALCAWSRAWRLRAQNEAEALNSEKQVTRAEVVALESALAARGEPEPAEAGRGETAPAPRSREIDRTSSAERTALVADDDVENRQLACHALESAGFRWLSACDGIEALELIDRYDFPVEIAVIEVLLPDMRGESLAERLIGRHAGLAVLYTSTVPHEELIRRGLLRAHEPLLGKPFTADQLMSAVRGLGRSEMDLEPSGALAVSGGER